MSRPSLALGFDVRGLLDREREVPPLPAVVRARVLRRAHAVLVAYDSASGYRAVASLGRRAAMLALACVASALVGAVAYELNAYFAMPHAHAVAAAGALVQP
jgi:hypothetical protein